MSYNKARAERKWVKWKNDEEQQFRELGVDEDVIQRLYRFDWEMFKSDRRFYEKRSEIRDCFYPSAQEKLEEIFTVDDLLNAVEDEKLLSILRRQDEKTLCILIWKINGYTSEDISQRLRISVNAVNLRMSRLKRSLKKYFQL